MNEEWKLVPWNAAYEVSSFGRVRSVDRVIHIVDGRVRCLRGRLIKTCLAGRDKREVVRLVECSGQRGQAYYVSRLVLLAFVGDPVGGMEASHINGDRLDNRLANLCWESRAENEARKAAHGTRLHGDKAPWAKLTEAAVRSMRAEYSGARGDAARLARKYGIDTRHAWAIVKRHAWKSVV